MSTQRPQPRAATDTYITDRGLLHSADTIHSLNPSQLIEKITRERIHESFYWKASCFGLNSATLCDRAVALKSVGGMYASGVKVSQFLCLLYKMIHLQPDRDIVKLYLSQEEWKYLRVLAAFYVRLTWKPKDVFETLEPLLEDRRKIKYRGKEGVSLTYVDEFVDRLLTEERVCDIQLPRLPARITLEDQGVLEPRESALQSDIDSSSDEEE